MKADGETRSGRILIVDDDEGIRDLLSNFLPLEGYQVKAAADGPEALEFLREEPFDLALTDLKMPQMSGLEFISRARQIDPTLCLVMMTGFGTLETAVEAMKQGAYDYFLKPFKVEDVLAIVARGLCQCRLARENIDLKETVQIYDASERISSTLQRDAVYAYILNAFDAVLDPDYAALYLRAEGEKKGDYRLALERGGEKPSDLDLMRGQLKVPALLRYFADKKPCLLQGEEGAAAFQKAPLRKPLASLVALPVSAKDDVPGFVVGLSFTASKHFREGQRRALSVINNRAAFALENASLYEDLQRMFYQTVEGFAKAIEAKDKYTHGHSERVRYLAILIARGLGLPEEETNKISQAAILHDIGKLSVDYSMLNYPDKLQPDDAENVRQHPRVGRDILQPILFLGEVIPAIYHHHEYFDGTGYPEKLKGEAIPLGARILAVADSYDAMTSDRSYRQALSHSAAIAEILRCAGKQFDPQVVRAFLVEIERERQSQGKAK